MGTFACILQMRRQGRYVETIADLAGLSRGRPMMALALAILMFSLAGIPPLAGFIGKLYVFKAAVDAGLVWFAVIGVVLSVVGAYYYLRIVKLMYFDEPAEAFDPAPYGAVSAVAGVCAALLLFFVVPFIASPLLNSALAAADRPGAVTGAPLGHGFRLLELGAVGSTNDVARELADQGEPEGLFVRAQEQTAGRGRHGRVWQSPPGNLHASLLLRPARPDGRGREPVAGRGPGFGRGDGRAVGRRRPAAAEMAQRRPDRRCEGRRHPARERVRRAWRLLLADRRHGGQPSRRARPAAQGLTSTRPGELGGGVGGGWPARLHRRSPLRSRHRLGTRAVKRFAAGEIVLGRPDLIRARFYGLALRLLRR